MKSFKQKTYLPNLSILILSGVVVFTSSALLAEKTSDSSYSFWKECKKIGTSIKKSLMEEEFKTAEAAIDKYNAEALKAHCPGEIDQLITMAEESIKSSKQWKKTVIAVLEAHKERLHQEEKNAQELSEKLAACQKSCSGGDSSAHDEMQLPPPPPTPQALLDAAARDAKIPKDRIEAATEAVKQELEESTENKLMREIRESKKILKKTHTITPEERKSAAQALGKEEDTVKDQDVKKLENDKLNVMEALQKKLKGRRVHMSNDSDSDSEEDDWK